MIKSSRVVAFVPAKGTSSRVKNKNSCYLDGEPLVVRQLRKLLQCPSIHEVYLDTESREIADLARELPIKVLWRDPELASNTTDGHELFYNQVRQVEADIYLQALCTSPFLEVSTIEKMIQSLRGSDEHDSAVLVRREKQYIWSEGRPTYGTGRIPNSVDLPDVTIECMALYAVKRDAALQSRKRIGSRPLLIPASPVECIDVNTPQEFELANYVARGMREQEQVSLWNLRSLLSSAMLSDVLDEMGLKSQVISSLNCNLPTVSILGRAKTLRLRRLEEGEDPAGIYDALKSYETVVPNDIIVVENELGDNAYFGELNARLAIRRGAAGAIIGGMTRDAREVSGMSFPVFSMGNCAKDVRGRATVDSINSTIHVAGVAVSPNDLIFADKDSVVVIPERYVSVVLKRVLEVLDTERDISLDIARNRPTNEILQRHGAF
jgi:regulator of RNase E activity RraA/CMP-N-acetylneuraminic acid synthetase